MDIQGKVVVVGSFNIDHVWQSQTLPRAGETLKGQYRTGPGGKGFNQATAAARAGAHTVFVCAVGEDGRALLDGLAAHDGITLRALYGQTATGTAGIYLDAQGRNSIIIDAGANALVSEAFVAAQSDVIAGAQVLLTQLESPSESVLEAMRMARAAGVITLFNPAPADGACPRELLAGTDILTPNETEFATLLACLTSERVDAGDLVALDDARLHRLSRILLPRGTVVLTLGAAGVFVSHRSEHLRGDVDECYRLPAQAVSVRDTTGAGDAFNGALAASLANSPETAFAAHLRFAIGYAGLSTEREGASVAMPGLEEWRARFGAV